MRVKALVNTLGVYPVGPLVLLDSFGKFTRVADAQRVKHWLETGESLPGATFKAVLKQKPTPNKRIQGKFAANRSPKG